MSTIIEFGGGSATLEGNALVGDVIKDKTFYNTDANEIQTGTLELTGDAVAANVVKGKTFYNTNPKSKITGTLELTGNAAAGDVLSGKTFYSTNPASKLTGSMTNNGAVSKTITPSTSAQSYTIPAGYHNGSGKVTVSAVSLSGNATAAQVLTGRTFYTTSLTKATGTMANQGAKTATLKPGGSYTIPAGYHNGSGKVTAVSHGSCRQISKFNNYDDGRSYSSSIDSGNNRKKAVFIGGTHSGGGLDGGGQGSNNNSSWTDISTGIHTYRYFRAYAHPRENSSVISYGYLGFIDLGYS